MAKYKCVGCGAEVDVEMKPEKCEACGGEMNEVVADAAPESAPETAPETTPEAPAEEEKPAE